MSPGIQAAVPADTYPRRFSVDVKPERRVVRVCPSGDIDIATAGLVRDNVAELATAGFRCVVVDLREVTFLDSTGVHLMVDLEMASRTEGWRFGIIEGPAEVQRAFEVTGLRGSLPFVAPAANTVGPEWEA